MSDQNQLNKEEQPLENRTQTADNENVPSVSNINAEFKENDISEEEMDGQKIWSRSNQEESRGNQMTADLKEPRENLELVQQESPEPAREESPEPAREESPEPAREESPEPAREESPEPAREESPEPAREESPEPARQEMPESRGHQLKADQKDLREDLEPAEQERPESREHQLKADLKELRVNLEPVQLASQEPAREESPEPAREESPEPAREESPEPARQAMLESRGHQLKPDQKDLRKDLEPTQQERTESRGHDLRTDLKEQKEDLMVDVVPARKEGPEAARKDGLEAAQKEDPEPTQAEIQKPEPTVVNLGTLGAAAVVVLIAVWLGLYLPQFRGTQTSDSRSALQIFQDKFKSLEEDFPKQSRDLWLRSEKMLRNHLSKSEPHEPAMIILTAAQDAKHTLLCLGSGLAQTYAAAHNAKWLVIHGPSESEYDDSTAKLHIDEKLSSGFQTESRAAVLNRLETLPPGSLLILYKYCDHENAAYKNVALVFTVLLEESSLEPGISLPELEEKVRDFLWQQFISSSTIRSHMEMDSDKLGGVWSRISHLVLPVVPVESIEIGNCPFEHEEN